MLSRCVNMQRCGGTLRRLLSRLKYSTNMVFGGLSFGICLTGIPLANLWLIPCTVCLRVLSIHMFGRSLAFLLQLHQRKKLSLLPSITILHSLPCNQTPSLHPLPEHHQLPLRSQSLLPKGHSLALKILSLP